jgi:hypothetical protein
MDLLNLFYNMTKMFYFFGKKSKKGILNIHESTLCSYILSKKLNIPNSS